MTARNDGTRIGNIAAAIFGGAGVIASAMASRALWSHMSSGSSDSILPLTVAVIGGIAAGVAFKALVAKAATVAATREWSQETTARLATLATRSPPYARPAVGQVMTGIAHVATVSTARQIRAERYTLIVGLMSTAGLAIASLWLPLVVLLVAGLGWGITEIAARHRQADAAEREKLDAARSAHLMQTITAGRDIQSLCAEGAREDEYLAQAQASNNISAQISHRDGAAGAITAALPSVASLIITAIGILLVQLGQIAPADLIAATILSGSAVSVIPGVAGLVAQLRTYAPIEERLADALAIELQEEGELTIETPRGALSITGLTVRHDGARLPVLDHLDLAVEPGEIVAVAGDSGSGKTTLLETIVRLTHAPAQGLIALDGTPIDALRLSSLRRAAIYVPQVPTTVAGTILDNVLLGRPDAPPADVQAALDMSGLLLGADGGFLSRPLTGGSQGCGLSVGQLQRLGLARAYLVALGNPGGLLLLDEPTASQDAASKAQVIAGIRQMAHGRAVIAVTHDAEVARIATRIERLVAGRLTTLRVVQSAAAE